MSTWKYCAGTFPPGIKLEADYGRIYGLVPDSDATYTITIRATDVHGQYADSVFKIVTRGKRTPFFLFSACH
jgi:hypothetical protein